MGQISLTISSVDDPPVVSGGEATTEEDVLVSLSLISLVSDIDSDNLTYSIVQDPQFGQVNLLSGVVYYSPNADFNGIDRLTFGVSDGTTTATAEASFIVTAVNDAPVAQSLVVEILEDEVLTSSFPASDVDGDVLTFELLQEPALGSLIVDLSGGYTYTPPLNASGSDSIRYRVSDGEFTSGEGEITLNIIAVNDSPVATDLEVSVDEDDLVTIDLSATDVDSETFVFTVGEPPVHGEVSIVGSVATYTPAPDYYGADVWTYVASDDAGGSSEPANVVMTVANQPDAPVASDQLVEVNDTMGWSFTLDASDVDGDALTVTVVDGPSAGELSWSGIVGTYTPTTSDNGFDGFSYRVSDGVSESAVATVTVLVGADSDGDGLPNSLDNCPGDANLDQADFDDDGVGDVCDDDVDGDGFLNADDLCPGLADDGMDLDEDGIGNMCDPDRDGDTLSNELETLWGWTPMQWTPTKIHWMTL